MLQGTIQGYLGPIYRRTLETSSRVATSIRFFDTEVLDPWRQQGGFLWIVVLIKGSEVPVWRPCESGGCARMSGGAICKLTGAIERQRLTQEVHGAWPRPHA
jgi:hypothetical protein